MRIGLIAPPWVTVPPIGYGGTEVVIDNLARSLSAMGHDVRLFTVGDSTCPVQRSSRYPTPPPIMGTSIEEAAHVLTAYEELADADVIHDHTVLGPLLARDASTALPPIVCTQHGAFTADNIRIFTAIARHAHIVAISHDQARDATTVPIAAVIHHGIDVSAYQPGPGDGGYLMFVGRMSPDKGVAAALRVAHSSGFPLRMAVKMREPAEHDYFEQHVRALLRDGDELVLEPSLPARLQMIQHARALLNPIAWREPFGLVMAEALACGTPVLTFRLGAAVEIVEDHRTGFFCHDETEMVAAVGRIGELDRATCRQAAVERFSMQRMATDYHRLYRRIMGHGSRPALRPLRSTVPRTHHVHPDSAPTGR